VAELLVCKNSALIVEKNTENVSQHMPHENQMHATYMIIAHNNNETYLQHENKIPWRNTRKILLHVTSMLKANTIHIFRVCQTPLAT
jgi:hypothetical protein